MSLDADASHHVPWRQILPFLTRARSQVDAEYMCYVISCASNVNEPAIVAPFHQKLSRAGALHYRGPPSVDRINEVSTLGTECRNALAVGRDQHCDHAISQDRTCFTAIHILDIGSRDVVRSFADEQDPLA